LEDADRDIFNANDMIDNVLFPTRDRLTNTLRQLRANIDQNRKTLRDETSIREREHRVFEAKIAEHNEALSAIDECLGLLSQLGNPSLV
jgi:chromosome segregation ATPase